MWFIVLSVQNEWCFFFLPPSASVVVSAGTAGGNRSRSLPEADWGDRLTRRPRRKERGNGGFHATGVTILSLTAQNLETCNEFWQLLSTPLDCKSEQKLSSVFQPCFTDICILWFLRFVPILWSTARRYCCRAQPKPSSLSACSAHQQVNQQVSVCGYLTPVCVEKTLSGFWDLTVWSCCNRCGRSLCPGAQSGIGSAPAEEQRHWLLPISWQPQTEPEQAGASGAASPRGTEGGISAKTDPAVVEPKICLFDSNVHI